jgi:hypothetical protein
MKTDMLALKELELNHSCFAIRGELNMNKIVFALALAWCVIGVLCGCNDQESSPAPSKVAAVPKPSAPAVQPASPVAEAKVEPKKDLKELDGAFCKIDVAQKTVRVAPWDGKGWRKSKVQVLAWDDDTQMVSGPHTMAMGVFVKGKPLDDDSKTVDSIRGERAQFNYETVAGKKIVRKIEMIEMFGGESFPAMIGSNGAQVVGSTRVPCRNW